MRRLQAITSLALLAACAAVLVVGAARPFPRGLIVAVLVVAAAAAAGHAIRRRGGARVVLVALGVGLALASVGAAVVGGLIPEAFVAIGCLAGALALARRVFTVRVRLARAPRPLRPVVIWNPKSGGGKALAADLAGEARARGIEPIELTPGADLVELVEGALTGGADGLAAAGSERRRSSPRSRRRTTCRSPASRPGPGTTSPSTSASTERTWSVRWTRS